MKSHNTKTIGCVAVASVLAGCAHTADTAAQKGTPAGSFSLALPAPADTTDAAPQEDGQQQVFISIARDGSLSVAGVGIGDRIEIPETDITDWRYMRDGKMVGNYTLKPLFRKIPPGEVERLKRMMAEP